MMVMTMAKIENTIGGNCHDGSDNDNKNSCEVK